MRIAIHGLVLTGPDKPNAELKPGGESHLVFGPTDTGKSYIEECIAYCLGSDEHPRNVGFSEGYTRAALQVLGPDGSECSGLMKPDTHLGENARQNEVSDDQTTPYLFP